MNQGEVKISAEAEVIHMPEGEVIHIKKQGNLLQEFVEKEDQDSEDQSEDRVAPTSENAVEYGSVSNQVSKQEEEEVAAEVAGEAEVQIQTEKKAETAVISAIDQSKVKYEATLSRSNAPTFNPMNVQNGMTDSEEEGGRYVPAAGSSMRSSGDASEEGGIMRPGAGFNSAEKPGKYLIYGFSIRIPEGNSNSNVIQALYSFDDVESAMASVNGDKFLMPTQNGFKVVSIVSGAPEISTGGVRVLVYVNGKWKK